MTGAEILTLLKDASGYGLAALFAWLWLQERARNTTLQDARIGDWRDFGSKLQSAIDGAVHALDKLEDAVKSIKP